jgi:Zn-dependent protease
VSETVKFALFLLVLLPPALVLHEYAHVWAASKLGDWTIRRYGRMTLDPRPHIDKFGSLLLPALLVILVASGVGTPVFAYGKPMQFNPSATRNPERSTVWFSLAGPLANLALAIPFGVGLRMMGLPEGSLTDLHLFLIAGLVLNVVFCVFNLMPIPGLDGARILARFLPPRAREVYQRMDEYLPLFMLLIFFLLAAPALSIVTALSNVLCRAIAGGNCPI